MVIKDDEPWLCYLCWRFSYLGSIVVTCFLIGSLCGLAWVIELECSTPFGWPGAFTHTRIYHIWLTVWKMIDVSIRWCSNLMMIDEIIYLNFRWIFCHFVPIITWFCPSCFFPYQYATLDVDWWNFMLYYLQLWIL